MVAFSTFALLSVSVSAATLVVAHPHPYPETRTRSAPLPQRWYQDEDHPVHTLFRRQPVYYKRDPLPQVGSSTWAAQYPADSPDPNNLPKAWKDALDQAVNAGKIPSIPPSVSEGGNTPNYPQGVNENRNDASICAATDRLCRNPDDIWDGPDGYFGVGFDDGPLPPSPRLYQFLQQNNQSSTHYFIGQNILQNWQIFQQCYNMGCDVAVHTWTHPYMTTQTNEQVLGQLGYTMQIIHDSTGGKIPRYWRPPYGDIDARVSAIAREVLGMTAVLWNQDTEDWTLSSNPPGTSLDKIQSNMQQWLSGSKTPGLIILEHELSDDTVQAFMNAWPLVGQNGWKPVSQAQLFPSAPPYQDGKESDLPFNSYITSSSSTSALASSTTSTSASASASSGFSNQSNTSGSTAVFVVPSLATFGVLIGGILALM